MSWVEKEKYKTKIDLDKNSLPNALKMFYVGTVSYDISKFNNEKEDLMLLVLDGIKEKIETIRKDEELLKAEKFQIYFKVEFFDIDLKAVVDGGSIYLEKNDKEVKIMFEKNRSGYYCIIC
jgi:serine/threonine protein phosphatase PrpC